MTALVVLLGTWADVASAALTAEGARQQVLAQLARGEVVGETLFRADFAAGGFEGWHADAGWTLVDAPGGGRCARVRLTGDEHEDLVLQQKVPVPPGHPVAVCWRERAVEGAEPLYLRLDFFDAAGLTGEPYAHQDRARTGADWVNNAVLASAWFPEYARSITLHFHHPADAATVSLLDQVRVVDLQPAIDAALAEDRDRAEQALAELQQSAGRLPETGAAGYWKRIVAERAPALGVSLGASLARPPGDLEATQVLSDVTAEVARYTEAVTALRDRRPVPERMLIYRTRATGPAMVLPDTTELPGALAQQLEVTACPGEAEPISLVLWAPEAAPGVLVETSALRGPMVITADAVEVQWVKCWYQAGSAPHGVSQDRRRNVLVPELLLNDDELVRVDLEAQENSVRLSFPDGPRYVSVMDPKDVPWGWKAARDEFPVRDSPTLQPLDLPANRNQQVWLTVTVPATAKAGTYRGEIRVRSDDRVLARIPLALRVLPFSLPEPRAHWDPAEPFTYSLYYWGELDPEGRGSIGYKVKSEQQFRAELQYMWDHGIVAPAMIWSPSIVYDDEPLFRKHLAIAQDIGMSGRPLYFADSGMIGNPTGPEELAKLQERVRRTLVIAAEYGFTGVYFYGLDEATGDRLASQRAAWQAVQEAGGKVIVSGFRGQFEAVGDILDLCNWCGALDPAQPPAWHGKGHRVWNYGNPQTPVEDPAVYRRNYGLLLWKLDYDGACTYCFMDSSGTPWNDFDCDAYRDHNVAYPTVDGVVGTLALDGLREGKDDVRYATLLRMEIDTALAGEDDKAKAIAGEAAEWLEGLDPSTVDLDEARAGMVERLLRLRG